MKLLSIFSRLAGDPQGTLHNCSEKARIDSSSQGATLLLPMIIWGAGSYATAHMMNASFLVRLLAAGCMAIIILILDRGMMSYVSKKNRSALGIISRFILAFAGSIIFAHPAVFIVAKGLIDNELTSQVGKAIESRKSQITPQLESARKRLHESTKLLQEAATVKHDAYLTKNEELKLARKKVSEWSVYANDEANGLHGTGASEGKKFRRAERYMDQEKESVLSLEQELLAARRVADTANKELTSTLKANKEDPEILRLENDLSFSLGKIRSHEKGDPFSRFEALHTVISRNWSSGSYSLGIGYVVVCIVILGFEIIPVCLKLGSGQGELALALELELFKAEQDSANLKEVYPALSMTMTRDRLMMDVNREKLRLDNDMAMDRVRVPAERTRLILIEQTQVFELANDLLRRGAKSKNAAYAKFSTALAEQLIEAFQKSVEAEIGTNNTWSNGNTGSSFAA